MCFTMKIVVLSGSPHKKGTSSALADAFIQGAQEAGHEIFRFDAAFQDVHPCIACERCHKTDKGCAFQDDMTTLNPHLLAADAVVFVSPIYYYDWNAQLKTVIDRFYANSAALRSSSKKAVLMLTMGDETMESADGAILTYKGMTRFLGWENVGILPARGCSDLEDLEASDYPRQAYEMGKTI